ncbi:BTAD domain-containing putative transcriptional regulator [Salinispora arenicola]|uniref:BTAD domain-containing putative transcriptional regulator n=1 Tax=Salinispora arenicola TaxID=168697 RepID=UPI00036B7F0F|nr:BTAD domain-containing putative transcriptional regulator [Salinispora arenicola]
MIALLAATARRLAGLALLLLLTAGVPSALIRYVGWPLPAQVPTLQDIGTALTSPLTDTMLGNLVVCLLWLAWAAFAWSLLAEIVEVVAGIRLPQPKAMAPARGLAALLVTAITGGVLATAAQAAPTLIHPAVATGHSTTAQATAGADRASGATQAPPTVTARPGTPETPGTARPATRLAAGQITLVTAGQSFECKVEHGDTLSEIAKEWLGDANRWPEIWALNRGTHFAQVGGTFTSPHLIYPGWVLELPKDATPPATAKPAPPPAPPKAETPSTPEQAQPTNEPAAPEATAVQPGPTTSRPIDDGVTEPVPASPATTSTPSAPSGMPGNSATSTPAAASSPASGATDPADSLSTDAGRPDGISLGTGSWLDLGLAAAIAAGATLVWALRRRRYEPRPPDTHTRAGDPDLAPMPTVVTQVRRGLRRRLTDDNDGLDILDTSKPAEIDTDDEQSTSGSSNVEDQAPGTTDTVPSEKEPKDEEAPPVPVPVVPALDNPLAAVWPPAGLGLTGPGNEAAGRGFLTAALAAGGVDDPDARSWVVIPSMTAATLLGTAAVALPETPRLTVTGGLDDALDILEAQTLHRTRLVYQHEVDTISDLRHTDPYEEWQPPIVLIADATASHERTRIAALLAQGQRLDIHGILLGPWPDGDTIIVDSDGTTSRAAEEARHGTHSADIGRLAVLTPEETIDVITTLAEAHTGVRQASAPAEPTTPAPAPDSQPSPATPLDVEQAELAPDPVALEASTRTAPQPNPGNEPDSGDREDNSTDAPGPRIAVRVLGDTRIIDMDTTVPLRAKALELLVYLIVHDGDASQDAILDDLLPEAPRSKAPHRLHTYVSALRKTLARTGGAGSYLTHPSRRYALAREAIDTDLWRMRDALSAAERATDDSIRITALRTAVDAYGGGLADGYDYEWIEVHREGIRRQALDAHLALAAATTDPAEALTVLDAAMRHDPYAEPLYQQAMRARAALEHLDEIRALRRNLTRRLEEIDAEPSDDTIALADQLIADLRSRRPAGHANDGGHRP